MQSLSRSAYSDAFSYSDPKATSGLLKARVAAAKEVNERLAMYFAERAEAEEAYAKAIQRALTSLKTGKTPFDIQHNPALGSSSVKALERVIEYESAELVRMHEVFARRCRDQLEVPLRSRASKDDWTAVQKHERNTEALMKEYEEAQHKYQKAQQKAGGSLGGKKNAEKLPALQEDLQRLEHRLQESAPGYLNTYQQFDFGRLTSVKELLTVYETLQNDLGRERMETAERGLESILTWEVEQELTEFVSREGFKGTSGRAPARATSNGRQQGNTPLPPIVSVDSPTGEFGQSQATNERMPATTPIRQRTNTDSQSIRSGRADSFTSSRQGDGRSGGFLSAFKSGGGSKLDRRKSTAVQQQQQRQALNGADSDDERDAFRSSGSASLGRPSRDRQQSVRSSGMGSDDEDSHRAGGLKVNTNKSKRSSFMPGFLKRNNTSARRDSFSERQSQRETTPRASDNNNSYNNNYSQQPRTAPAHSTNFDTTPLASPMSENRRTVNNFDEMEEIGTPAMSPDPPKTSKSLNPFSSAMSGGEAGAPGGSSGGAVAAGAGIAAAASAAIAAGERRDSQPQVDEQGYSVPPADYNKPAWQSGGGNDLMDMPDSDDENQKPQSMQVNIAPATAKAGETDAEREAAMLRMKNTLLQNKGSASGGSSSSVNRRATRGGRGSRQSTLGLAPLVTSPGDEVPLQSIVDARRQEQQQQQQQQEHETAPMSATPSSPNGSFMLASPTAPPVPTIPTPMRAGSILSTTSSQQQVAGVTSAFDTKNVAPGFRAAILETVNVLFRNGQIERVLVTGSVALSLNVPVSGTLKIRIANFERFDKSAPNKTFLQASSTPGEFVIDAQALQNSHTPVTTVLKYQVKTDNLNARAFVPIEVNAQWKLEPNQTSFLMTYHGNPECQFASADPAPSGEVSSAAVAKLQDVAFSVPVIGEGVSNVQSKPAGTYSMEKHRILWKMDDMDLSTARAAKILSRWQVTSAAQPQPVSVQWRLPDRLASQTDLQVVEGDGLKFDEIIRSTSSGKYQAH